MCPSLHVENLDIQDESGIQFCMDTHMVSGKRERRRGEEVRGILDEGREGSQGGT